MAAMVLRDGASLSEAEFEAFLADQADLSPKAWPRFVRIAADLPSTATNKILKRELIAEGPPLAPGPCGCVRSAGRRTPWPDRWPVAT